MWRYSTSRSDSPRTPRSPGGKASLVSATHSSSTTSHSLPISCKKLHHRFQHHHTCLYAWIETHAAPSLQDRASLTSTPLQTLPQPAQGTEEKPTVHTPVQTPPYYSPYVHYTSVRAAASFKHASGLAHAYTHTATSTHAEVKGGTL